MRLPTREEINYEDEPDTSARDWPTWLNRMARIAVAYRNRDLMTRAEWEASIDYEAIAVEIRECFAVSHRLAFHLAERFVRAGTGSREELDEWMARRNAAAGIGDSDE